MNKSPFKICLIGAGQIGSRHLQALKKVKLPLEIMVIDPSEKSLTIAKQRYEEMPAGSKRQSVKFLQQIPENRNIDLAIVATTSHIRAQVTKSILEKNRIRYLILEKLLFDKKSDYSAMEKVFAKLKVKTWVNCPLRIRPIYQKIKKDLTDKKISFRLIGSQFGLATNTIHCLDFVSYLVGSTDFTVNTDWLDPKLIPSKRQGFSELNGTISAHFKNGAQCELTNYPSGNTPRLVEVFNQDTRYMFLDQEADGQASVSTAKNGWQWKKIPFHTPLISETTTKVVENILKNGNCGLTPYSESMKVHLAFLEPLRQFLNKNSQKKYDYYPFT